MMSGPFWYNMGRGFRLRNFSQAAAGNRMDVDLRSSPWWTRLRLRRALVLAIALWSALAASLCWWLVDERLRDYRQQTLVTAGVRVNAVKDTLLVSLEQLIALPLNLAHRPIVRDYVLVPHKIDLAGLSEVEQNRRLDERVKLPAVQAMTATLDDVARDFRLPLVSLIDTDGDVIATSTVRTADGSVVPPRSLTNLRTRDYFSQAMAQGASLQFLIGRFSKAPGMYFAHRVDIDGQARGVALVKQDADTLNRLLSDPEGGLIFITDTNGVIVLANRTDLLMHRVPGAPERSPSLLQSVYQAEPERLNWTTAALPAGPQVITATTLGGMRHVTLSAPLAARPFTIWVLDPLDKEPTIAKEVLSAAALLWLLGCGLIGLAWRGVHWLHAALQARRSLLDMAQALPLTVFRYHHPGGATAGRFSFLGRGVEALFGVNANELAQDPTLPWRLAGDTMHLPPTEIVEFPVRRDEGAAWVMAQSTPQQEADGSTVYNGYWLDVSARRETELRLAAVFEHAPNSYLFFDRQRGIAHCNPATLALFGADDASQILGRIPWFPTLSPELQADGQPSRTRALELMRRHTRSGGRVQLCEWRFCRLDGTPFDTDVSVIVLDWEGEPQFCAVIQDITLRKQTEVAMQQARDAAEAASQTKSSFLANMSHELRTPMNAIIGMTHLALEDGLPDKQRGYIQKAHGSARNLLQILNDILDVSKIEAGHLDLERIDFELETVVGEMADLLGLKAEEKGLEVLYSAAPDLPARLVGDPTRLRQVLVNLGSNAIKFTDAGEVTIGMELQSQDTDSVELHGWVRDTGAGLSAEQLSRIFKPFAQADSSTTRRFGGTGLGLVISQQLVQRMGGRLWVDSEPGRGSTFHFSVRMGRSTPRAPARAWMFGELRGRRALLVDDNQAAIDVLSRMLEAFGVVVDRAGSGEQALELLAQQPDAFRWILLDWKMPGMDGVACARQMLQRHPQLRPCILLVTAFGRDDALRASAGVPLAGLLQKPVTPSSLHDSLLQAGRIDVAERGATALPSQRVRQRLAGARILLVEDHPLNQELACELLRRAGMQVVVASDGQQALDILAREGTFDGVLMDCQMPVMDGYTATQRLRQNPEWTDLPVIAMTASALVEDRARALASGMNAHITKPINVELMLRTMADWIGTRRPPESPDEASSLDDWPPIGVATHIDTVDGLARCIGKSGLYRRVLRGFRAANLRFPDEFAQALAELRWDDARRAAHDLKGLAGTIGANRLQSGAAALHDAVAARDMGAAHEQLLRVRGLLDPVLREIDLLVPPA